MKDSFEDLGVPDSRLYQQFLQVHRENAHVYGELLALALQVRRRGFSHYGIGGLFEVLRWHRALSTSDTEFKLNNNHRAFYARLMMREEPELSGFFQLREQGFTDPNVVS